MSSTFEAPAEPAGALAAYGWNEQVSERIDPFLTDGAIPARVIRIDRGGYLIATGGGVERCHPARSDPAPGSEAGPPAAGDWISARLVPGLGFELDAIVRRSSVVRRLDAEGDFEQVLVANLDAMLVLHGFDRPHRVGRIERCCILAWDAGVEPTVLLTKSDLLDTGRAVIDLVEAIDRIHAVLPSVDVMTISSTSGAGLGQLRPLLGPGTTIGLMGESGSGKSTLINALAGAEVQATGRTRTGDSKGRHTTTSRSLIPIPGGAVLVDMPGIRTIGMLDNDGGLARAHADLQRLFADCRFRNCAHESEPGCAVQEALDDGRVDPARWKSYRKLQREIAYETQRAERRVRRAAEREWGKKLRSVRHRNESW